MRRTVWRWLNIGVLIGPAADSELFYGENEVTSLPKGKSAYVSLQPIAEIEELGH